MTRLSALPNERWPLRRLGNILATIASLHAARAAAASPAIAPAELARLPTRDLQIIQADRLGARDRRWVVWDEGIGDDQSAHAALCSTDGACQWSRRIPDAYQPAMTLLGNWSDDPTLVFLLTYQYGAEAQQADIYALPPGRQPRLLASRLAATVTLRADGEIELGGTETRTCLSAPPPAYAIRSTRCP